MQGWNWLKRLYQTHTAEACRMLAERDDVRSMLVDRNMVLFLKYLQNLDALNADALLRTLLLSVMLAKYDLQKLKKAFPYRGFSADTLRPNQLSTQYSLYNGILQKIATYLNFCLTKPMDPSQELQVLTSNMGLLKINCKEENIVRYGEMFQNFIEEVCYSFWLKLEKSINIFEEFDDSEFISFYHDYCTFCNAKRRISKMRNKNLRSVEVSSEMNRKIEQRQLDLQYKMTRNYESCGLERGRGIAKLVSMMEDFDEDD